MSTTHTYTRDGIEVARYADGLVKWGPADRLLDNCIPPAYAAAIHAAYLDSLGLWLDEETGCLVDTASRRPGPSQEGSYNVLRREPGGHMETDDGWTGQIHPDERDQAVDRYVATLTPPQPEPQPGEVWEVTLDDGSKVTARAATAMSGSVHLYPPGLMNLPHDPTLPRRRLLTADREWVGGES